MWIPDFYRWKNYIDQFTHGGEAVEPLITR